MGSDTSVNCQKRVTDSNLQEENSTPYFRTRTEDRGTSTSLCSTCLSLGFTVLSLIPLLVLLTLSQKDYFLVTDYYVVMTWAT